MGLQARWLVLENFKSYDGRVKVGPFKKFTCVVGPNGAGKSNLVDAISFVLGVHVRHVRGEHIRDLINRSAQQDPTGRTTCVELLCERRDPAGSGDATGEGVAAVVAFRRVILPGGEQTQFQVDGETLSHAEYTARLAQHNLLPKARNFLVSQGDLEAASWRQGRELTHFFEQVSGSIEFRQLYEQLEAEKNAKEENARVLFMRKRNAMSECKRVEEQKDEADRYRREEARKRECQMQYFLFSLYCIRHQLQSEAQAMAAEEVNRVAAERDVASLQQRAQDAERARCEARLLAQRAGRAFADAEARRQRADASEDAAKLEAIESKLTELRSSAERFGRRMQALRDQVAQLGDEKAGMEASMRRELEEAERRRIHFTEAQRKEFEQARAKAERITAHRAAQARELEARIRAASDDRGHAERDTRELMLRRNHLRQRVSDLIDAQEEAQAALRRDEQLANDRRGALQGLRASREAREQTRARLSEQRDKILKEIQDITATGRQIEQERKTAQTIQDLTNSVPGVHGRVLNLFRVQNERVEVALNVALGSYLDAVVVDTAATAHSCVRHLKDRMLPPLTCMPLDAMSSQPPPRRLEDLVRNRQSLRMALNCVTFNRQFQHVFEFLVGDVVIADSLDEGRRFVFESTPESTVACRVVTVFGETISRDGNMAFNSEAARKDATRFELANLGAKKDVLVGIDKELYELQALDAVSVDAAALQSELERMDARASASKVALEERRAELAMRNRELEATQQQLDERAAEAVRLEREEAALRDQQRQVEDEISQAVAEHFASLSQKMGVDDIHRRECDSRRGIEDAQAQVRKLEQKCGIVDAELRMLAQTIADNEARDPAADIAECEQQVAALRAREADAPEGDTAEEIAQLEATWRKLQDDETAWEKAAGELNREVREAQQRLSETDRSLRGLGATARRLRDQRLNILRQSVLEGVELPLTEGRPSEYLEELVCPAAPAEHEVGIDLDALIDLERLPVEQRDAAEAGEAAIQLMEAEYRERLARHEKELERLQPNMKAAQQLSAVQRQAQGATQSVIDGRADIEDVTRRFEEVRRKRCDRFMRCFTVVQEEITAVYRQLTSGFDATGTEGGRAFLDLEDVQDPYNGGVKFTAMPPGKRFSDVSLLSGGEKALAALALLFATQAYQRPPFLVLDEVDAHLDSANIHSLARYVSLSDCQMIVVSLKDTFFTRSEGLVGVTKHQESSAIFTLDLQQFRRPPLAPLPPASPLGSDPGRGRMVHVSPASPFPRVVPGTGPMEP